MHSCEKVRKDIKNDNFLLQEIEQLRAFTVIFLWIILVYVCVYPVFYLMEVFRKYDLFLFVLISLVLLICC